ncbi:MAG TPA: zinc ribbon domain-containing protein [Burkholderiales bacterium]|nr:zinc ribbon domain-containing protein [Burkholderiales bacterium]
MPIYEYRCEACGHQEEFLQRVSEPPLTECPVCRKPTFHKMLSAAGFQLKGSGWYATDFRSKPGKPAEKKADDKSDAKTESKPDSKPESKPEKKTDAKSEAAA